MKRTTTAEDGVALVRALFLTVGAVVVMVAGFVAGEFGGHWLLGVPLWVGAGALIWKARPAIMNEIREGDRRSAHPVAVRETGRDRRNCLCCRQPTWEDGVDTCPLCEWAPDVTTGSGVPIPLATARANVASHLSVYPQDDRPPWSPEPLSTDEIQLRRRLHATYRKIQRGQKRFWFRARALENEVSSRAFRERET